MQFTDKELATIGMAVALNRHLIAGGNDKDTNTMIEGSLDCEPTFKEIIDKIVPYLVSRAAHLQGLAELVKNGKPQ